MARLDAGGIEGVAGLLREDGGAIEADLQRFYGLHLGDFPWPLTARRLLVLIEHLPADSAIATVRIPVQDRAWDLSASLLAAAVDELRVIGHQQLALGRVPRHRMPPAPRPIDRPGARGAATQPVDQERLARVLAHHGVSPRGIANRDGGEMHG